MADYKSIKGTKIQNYTTDPDNPLTGQVWYNETDQVLKFQYVLTEGSWSTGGNLNTARNGLAGAGIQTAALAFGGASPYKAETESYNGSNWTEVNDLNAARSGLAGAGTQTAALAFGGFPDVTFTETWNGTNWTEVNNLNTSRTLAAGAGTNTAALTFGGNDNAGPGVATAATESW